MFVLTLCFIFALNLQPVEIHWDIPNLTKEQCDEYMASSVLGQPAGPGLTYAASAVCTPQPPKVLGTPT